MRNKTYRSWALLFTVVIAVGLFLFSTIFLIINKTMSPYDASGNLLGEMLQKRLPWRSLAENFSFGGILIYFAGHLFVAYLSVKRKEFLSPKEVLFYFLTHIVLIIACTIPFSLFDFVFFYDYIFQVRLALVSLAVLLIVFIVAPFFFRKRA